MGNVSSLAQEYLGDLLTVTGAVERRRTRVQPQSSLWDRIN